MDFQKVAEGEGLAVYQADVEVKPAAVTKAIGAAFDRFGSSVRALSVSDDGLTVRVEQKPLGPCAKCGQPLEDGAAFCSSCGRKVDR